MLPFKHDGLLPDYPFGTDFTELEQRLIPVLQELKKASKSKLALLKLILKGLRVDEGDSHAAALKRLNLKHPTSISDKMTRYALLGLLAEEVS